MGIGVSASMPAYADAIEDPAVTPSSVASNGMSVSTYASTFDKGYGVYLNIDFDYELPDDPDALIVWRMPQALSDEGFSIVTTGMLAPQVTEPVSNDGSESPIPIYVSDSKDVLMIETSVAGDWSLPRSGTLSFALHADGNILASSVTMKDAGANFANIPLPDTFGSGDLGSLGLGFTRVSRTGSREKRHTFTIRFDSNGGTKLVNQTVTDGSLGNFRTWGQNLPSPSKPGHCFLGWFTDADLSDVFDPFQTPLKNMTLHAKYSTVARSKTALGASGGNDVTINASQPDLVSTGVDQTRTYIATSTAFVLVAVGATASVVALRQRGN